MPFLAYEEPDIVQILIIISFFTFLGASGWLAGKVVRASLIGPIIVGIIYGTPLSNILLHEWQETFLALGYIGLILLIFEGGMTTRLDLLKKYLFLSVAAATSGVVLPIGLSYLLLYLGFGFGAVETFIVGAALSTTSLGTTFAVLSSAASTVQLAQTRVGTILVSAAVIDDVSGLVMASVIGSLDGGSSGSLGWTIGRPILASILMAGLTPLLTKYVLGPVFRRFIEPRTQRHHHAFNGIFMVSVLCAFLAIAAYAGTSVLFGAFIAGAFLAYLPTKGPEGFFSTMSREHAEEDPEKSPTFIHTWEKYLMNSQEYLLAPLFFASIGFAIPFLELWTGRRIWTGLVYTLLMAISKLAVGAWVPLWDTMHRDKTADLEKKDSTDSAGATGSSMVNAVYPSLLLGSAMVARGEIGLLIIEIGYNETSYVSEEAFIVAVWAILLNTIVGPVTVGIIVKLRGRAISEGSWGAIPATGIDSS